MRLWMNRRRTTTSSMRWLNISRGIYKNRQMTENILNEDFIVPTHNDKSYEQHREHFIYRLAERYGIILTNAEYDHLCSEGYKRQNYEGKYLKGGYRSIGFLTINGIKVLVNYYQHVKCFTTALPMSNLDTPKELIQTCFSRPVRHIAYHILEIIVKELESGKMEFDSDKEMALYYMEHHYFPSLAIDKYKYGVVDYFKIMRSIRNVLCGRSTYSELTIRKKNR